MKILRRILLSVLLAGTFGMIPALMVQYSASDFAGHLGSFSVACVFGLQLWATAFLKVEPNLSRTALVGVIVYVLAFYFWLAFHPDN
jgi:hypothetical protein